MVASFSFCILPRPSKVVSVGVWYGFWVRDLIKITQKSTTLEGLVKFLINSTTFSEVTTSDGRSLQKIVLPHGHQRSSGSWTVMGFGFLSSSQIFWGLRVGYECI